MALVNGVKGGKCEPSDRSDCPSSKETDGERVRERGGGGSERILAIVAKQFPFMRDGSDISAGTLSIRHAASPKIRVRSAPRLFVVVAVAVVAENRGRM